MVLVAASMLASCAGNVRVSYSGRCQANACGTIVAKLSVPIQRVSVTVDDYLVVEDEHTEFVRIDNVPSGRRTVHIVGYTFERDPLDMQVAVVVSPGQTETVLAEIPPFIAGYYVYLAATTLAMVILLRNPW